MEKKAKKSNTINVLFDQNVVCFIEMRVYSCSLHL